MATDLERLVVSLDADITRLSKQMARATGDVDAFASKADAASRRAAKAINDNLDKGLRPDQLKNLGFQAQDIFTSLASGAPVMQVLAQQGGQVYGALADTPGGAAAGVKDLSARFLGLLTPARLVAGGVATIGVAAGLLGMRWEDAQDKITLGLSGVGKASGATVRQINEIASAAAASGRITVGSAREAATAIAATGRVDASNIPAVLGLLPGYAKLFGKDVAEAGSDLARIFADPVKGADELDARLGVLDDRTRQYIRTLAAQGDRQGAIRVLAQVVQPELDAAAAKTSLWARAWGSVTSAADAAGRAVATAVATAPLDERTREAERRREAASNAANRGGNVNAVDPAHADYLRSAGLTADQVRAEVSPVAPGAVDNTKALTRALQDATAEAERLEEEGRRLGAQRFNDTMNAQARELSKTAGEATRALNAEGEALQALEDRYVALDRATSDNRARGMLEDADKTKASVDALGQRVKQLREDYAAGGTAAAAAMRAAAFQEATAGLSTYARGLMDINRQFDELRRNAIATTDAAKLPDALRSIETARGRATSAFDTETAERARGQVGIPSDYYGLIRSAESSGNDRAVSSTGAVGRYQFTEGTWLELFKKEKDARFAEIARKYADPEGADRGRVRADVLALRTDPDLQEDLVRALTTRNAASLDREGFASTSRNLYLAHNIGAGGASALLRAERDGRGDASARSVLDPIDPRLASSNRGYYDGRTVTEALAVVDRKARGGSAESRAQQERVRTTEAETAATGRAVAERERLASVEEQLRVAREAGQEVANRFASADELLKNGTAGLTGEVKAQTEEILRNAEARSQASARNLNAGLRLDLSDAYGALGRTPGEQQDFLQARRFGAEGSEAFQGAYSQLQELRTLTEAKSSGSGFIKDIAYDLQRGVGFAQALSGALSRLAGKLLDKGIDALFNAGFGSGGGLGSLVSAIGTMLGGGGAIPRLATGGHVSGPGTGTSDSIPAMLSDGEFIVNSRAARANLPLLRAINAGRARGYAAGGLVGTVGAMPAITMARPPTAANGNGSTDRRVYNFDMRGSNLTEDQARAMFLQALAANNAERDRTQFERAEMARRGFG